MTIDALLFARVAILAAQAALLRPGITLPGLRRAAQLDRGYGLGAMLLVAAGIGRVLYGAKAAQSYRANPLFWTKIVLFAALALLAVPPSVQLIRWSGQARARSNLRPADDQVRGVRRWMLADAVVLFHIPFVAAAMARGGGHG